MKQLSIPDPFLIQHLFAIAERYGSSPDQTISGSAIKGLRLLLALTTQCLNFVSELPSDLIPTGLQMTPAKAQAQQHRACQLILDVLRIRLTQREEQRNAGGKIFTSADYDAIRLWCRATEVLNPLPANLQAALQDPPSKPANQTTLETGVSQVLVSLPNQTDVSLNRTPPTTRTVRRKNGRTVTKQLRQRAKVAVL